MLTDIYMGSLPRNLRLPLPRTAAEGAGVDRFLSTVFRNVFNKSIYTSVGTDILRTPTKIFIFSYFFESLIMFLWLPKFHS